MTVLDDWPALPPIRTSSCCRDSRVSCETLSVREALTISPHKFDLSQPPLSGDSSSPDTASLNTCFFTPSIGHLFSCFPVKAPVHALSKPVSIPGKGGKRGASDVAGMLRSFVGGIHQSGPIAHSGAVSHPSPARLGAGSTLSYPNTPKGSKGHAANVFTMIPPDVVGKKKPAGYESDEPTSPEVTCVGRVRRKKHCKAWDALFNDRNEKGKGKKFSVESPSRKLNFLLSPRREKQCGSPGRGLAKPSRWKSAELMDRQGSPTDGISSSCKFSAGVLQDFDDGKCCETDPDGANLDGDNLATKVPPRDCLRLMRNSGRRRNCDDISDHKFLTKASEVARI